MSRVATFALALLAVLLLSGSTFLVREGESAIVVRFGEVSRKPILKSGLHFKLPLVDGVIRFSSRLISWDGDPEQIPVKDSKFIFVDTFARWRITDPLRFYNAVQDEQGAQSRLDDILDGSVRDVVSTHYLLELVRTSNRSLQDAASEEQKAADSSVEEVPAAILATGTSDSTLVEGDPRSAGKRLQVRQKIFALSTKKLTELNLGIQLVDLRIKRIEYTEQLSQDVYRRMISEQQRIAERYRAQGQGKRAEIAGLTTQEKQRIDSESYRKSQEILGQAEGESTKVYAEAYNRDPDFYRFLKSLETYRGVLGADDTLILSTDSDLLHYLKSQR
jgi:membrane protease subunit HflC